MIFPNVLGPLTRTEALNLISSYKDLISRHSSLLKRSHLLATKPDDSLAEYDGMDEAGPRRGTFWSKRSTEPNNGGSDSGSGGDSKPTARSFLHFSSIIRPKARRTTPFSSIIRPKSKRLFSSIVRYNNHNHNLRIWHLYLIKLKVCKKFGER